MPILKNDKININIWKTIALGLKYLVYFFKKYIYIYKFKFLDKLSIKKIEIFIL